MRNWKFKILALVALGAMVLSFSVGALAAKPDTERQLATVIPSDGRATVVIPQQATEVAPYVFNLGTVLYEGREVEGYAFIHTQKNFGKPTGCKDDGVCQGWESSDCDDCVGGGDEEDGSKCYGFLSRGAKWRTVEDYVVNPVNDQGLTASFITDNLAFNIAKWEDAAGTNILGDEVPGVVDGADLVSPDSQNEVYFGDVDYPGAIAITVVWGIWSGPPFGREIVEWDQVYDQTDFDWSASGEGGKMDFENIATHELGHSVGLDDLYETKCAEQTMYGYADYGETDKRTLEAGDIAGVKALYQ